MSLQTSQKQLKNFLPLAKLGQGTFSTVYKVKRIHDGQIYALKKIKMQKLNHKQQQNALNQIRILASLKSNFIVSYKQAFYDQSLNLLCIVMQFADGGDLQKIISDHVKGKTKVTEDEIWKAASQILLGLFILHEKGILHRDLKSANVFISNKSYKLGDLNVSKICNNQMAKTQTGTPYYTSPEVWRDEVYDSKCDVWSLGCLLYEMCCLMPPFHGCDLDDLFRAVQKGQYRPIPSDYSIELARLIKCCLTVDPKQRFSVKQLIGQFTFLNKRFIESLRNQQVQSDIPFLSTIKLPYDLKDLTKNLPLPDYDISLKQCPKTAYYEAGNKQSVMIKDKNVLEKEKIAPLPQRIKEYFKQSHVPLRKRPERPYTSSKRPQKIELKQELRPVSAVHYGSQKVNSPSNFSKKLKIVTGSQQVQAIRAKHNMRKQKGCSVQQSPLIQNRIQSCSPMNKLPVVNKPSPITLRSASKNNSQKSIYEQKLNNINTSLKEILPLNEKVYLQCKENSMKRISSLERKVQHIREERKEKKHVLERNKENAVSMRQDLLLRQENLDMKEKLKQKIKQSSEVFSLKRYQKATQFIPSDFHIRKENDDYLKAPKPDQSNHIENHFQNRLKNLYSGRYAVSADGKRDKNQLSLIQNKNLKQNQRKFGMIRQIPTNILPSIGSEKKPLRKDFDSEIYTKPFNKNVKAHQSIAQPNLVDNSEAIIRLKKRIKNRMICQSNRTFEVKESFSRNAPPINRFYY